MGSREAIIGRLGVGSHHPFIIRNLHGPGTHDLERVGTAGQWTKKKRYFVIGEAIMGDRDRSPPVGEISRSRRPLIGTQNTPSGLGSWVMVGRPGAVQGGIDWPCSMSTRAGATYPSPIAICNRSADHAFISFFPALPFAKHFLMLAAPAAPQLVATPWPGKAAVRINHSSLVSCWCTAFRPNCRDRMDCGVFDASPCRHRLSTSLRGTGIRHLPFSDDRRKERVEKMERGEPGMRCMARVRTIPPPTPPEHRAASANSWHRRFGSAAPGPGRADRRHDILLVGIVLGNK